MSKKSPASKRKPDNTKGIGAKNHSQAESRKSLEIKSYPRSWFVFCWILFGCYCYAAFFPAGPVWGIHWMAYIPEGAKILLLVIGGLLLVPKIQRSLYQRIANLYGMPKEHHKVRIFPAVIVAALCFVLFHSITIATDIYGDDIHMLKEYGDNTTFNWNWIGDVFSPHWVDNKEALTVAVHRIVAYIFSISIGASYKIMSELCGAFFIFVWTMFIQRIAKGDDRSTGPLRMVLLLLGMFSGAVLVFFGHVENYSFGILTFTLFLTALYFYIEDRIGTIPFVLLYLLALKAHIVGILFLPAFLLALAYRYRNKIPTLALLFNWRTIRKVIILPALAFGVLLYIFLFHSWNEPYAMNGQQFERSFLPLVTLPAPLNHYSLWSPYHIADLFNLFLLVAAPIMMVLMSLLIFNRKEIICPQPRVMLFGIAALFPFLFFVAMNPMLTPERDWDVYTLLFPPLLFFAAMLLIQPGVRPYLSAWLAQSLVFGAIFTSVLIAVNASPGALQIRLLDAGAYSYRSYYAGSDYIEARALALNDSSTAVISNYSNILEELSKGATRGKDQELANMMSRLASLDLRFGQDSAAISWARNACKTDTRVHRYVVDLAAYYVQLGRLDEGTRILNEFLNNKTTRGDTDHSYLEELAATMNQLAAHYSRTGNDSLTILWGLEAIRAEPLRLHYVYDLANYYMQSDRPRQALDLLHTIPPDSVTVDGLTTTAIAAANVFGPDSGLPYLYKAKSMAPNNTSVDSMILQLKESQAMSSSNFP